MRISDWSSDVCSSDLINIAVAGEVAGKKERAAETAREKGVDISLNQEGSSEFTNRDLAEIYDFILDRLRGYYADKGVPVQHFNAVAELRPASLYDFDRRIDAIGTFAQLPEAEALAAANKRIGNILKRSEEHTSDLQSLMRISYAVFCLKKKTKQITNK